MNEARVTEWKCAGSWLTLRECTACGAAFFAKVKEQVDCAHCVKRFGSLGTPPAIELVMVRK